MKKRKFKLFASVAAFALTGAMMTFGVLAAASHAVNVTTNVGFTSNGANGTIQIDVSGNASSTDNTVAAPFSKKASFTPSTFTPLAVEEVAGESPAITTDGWTSKTLGLGDLVFVQEDGEAQDIIISFTITKTGGAADNILTTTITVYNAATADNEKLITFVDGDSDSSVDPVALSNGTNASNVTITCSHVGATAATEAADNQETTDINEAAVTITFTIHVVDSGTKVENIPLYFHVSVIDGVPSDNSGTEPGTDPEEGQEG